MVHSNQNVTYVIRESKDKSYQKASSFGEKLGISKTYEGGNKINEKEVIDRLYERMEYFICVIHKGKFPTSMLTNLLGRGWGLGPPLAERRDTSRLSPLEAIIKLHKVEICSRPVSRVYSSQMKEWE